MYSAGYVKKVVGNTYFNKQPMSDSDYSRGRDLFVIEGCTANGILAVTSGAFLSGFASSLGANDSLNGVIGSIPTLLCVTQLFSSVVFENIRERKFLIAIMAFAHRMLLALMFFIPFVVDGTTMRLVALVTIFAISHFCGAFIGTGASNWLIHLVPGNKLGIYLGTRDAWGLGVTTIISLVMGRVLDHYRIDGREGVGFLLISTLVISLAFVNFYCLSSIKEPEFKKKNTKVRLKDVLIEPLKNVKFRKVIIFYAFWNLSLQIAGPFFAVYMVTGLKLPYTYITLIGLLASSSRVVAAAVWGRLADKKSWLWVTKSSMMLLAVTHFLWMFMTKDTYFILQPLLQVTSGIAWGGIAISMFNVQYIFAPEESKVMYVSANAAYAGIIGFSATLLGAVVLTLIKPMEIGGFSLGNMQILFAISGILIGGCAFYIAKVLERS